MMHLCHCKSYEKMLCAYRMRGNAYRTPNRLVRLGDDMQMIANKETVSC